MPLALALQPARKLVQQWKAVPGHGLLHVPRKIGIERERSRLGALAIERNDQCLERRYMVFREKNPAQEKLAAHTA